MSSGREATAVQALGQPSEPVDPVGVADERHDVIRPAPRRRRPCRSDVVPAVDVHGVGSASHAVRRRRLPRAVPTRHDVEGEGGKAGCRGVLRGRPTGAGRCGGSTPAMGDTRHRPKATRRPPFDFRAAAASAGRADGQDGSDRRSGPCGRPRRRMRRGAARTRAAREPPGRARMTARRAVTL